MIYSDVQPIKGKTGQLYAKCANPYLKKGIESLYKLHSFNPFILKPNVLDLKYFKSSKFEISNVHIKQGVLINMGIERGLIYCL